MMALNSLSETSWHSLEKVSSGHFSGSQSRTRVLSTAPIISQHALSIYGAPIVILDVLLLGQWQCSTLCFGAGLDPPLTARLWLQTEGKSTDKTEERVIRKL